MHFIDLMHFVDLMHFMDLMFVVDLMRFMDLMHFIDLMDFFDLMNFIDWMERKKARFEFCVPDSRFSRPRFAFCVQTATDLGCKSNVCNGVRITCFSLCH